MTTQGTSRVDTATLDGLIEGPVPPIPDGEKRLQQWVEFVRTNEMPFQLSVDGGSFSLLPDHEPLSLGEKDDLRDRLQQAVEQLIRIFPDDLRGRVFSTVRSTEFRQGKKIESLYVVTRQGVDVRTRQVAWSADERSTSSLRGLPWASISAGMAFLLVALIVSLFLVDYRQVIRGWLAPYTRVDAERYEVDASVLSPYIAVAETATDEKAEELEITLTRSASYPTTWEGFRREEERLRQAEDLRGYLLFQRVIVEGGVSVAYVAKDGKVLGLEERDVRSLRDKETLTVDLPVKRYPDATKIVLGD